MNYKRNLGLLILFFIAAVGLISFFFHTHDISLFDPKGAIGLQERNLIVIAFSLMLVVALPLLISLYLFAWKYRSGNRDAKREPERVGGVFEQLVWWAIPAVIIVAIAVLNWKSTHLLDPYRSLLPQGSEGQALTIRVVALQWKWLFIYPDQGIATVNFVEFPVNTPVRFELTADGPMSSFWIPQLGSQIYAMDAMQTQLNLIANTTGEFAGKDTEINGAGYAGMAFVAKSTSQEDFDAWVASVKQSPNVLDSRGYNALAAPSQYNPSSSYASVDADLYDTIMMKYMATSSQAGGTFEAPGVLVSSTSSDSSQGSGGEAGQAPSTSSGQVMPGMQM